MPHAVLRGVENVPALAGEPLVKEGGLIGRVVEEAESPKGRLLKAVLVRDGTTTTKLLARIDAKGDETTVHLDDHMDVERSKDVFALLAAVARRIVEENPDAEVVRTNLEGLAPSRPA